MTVPLSVAAGVTPTAGGSESHASPPRPVASGDGGGASMYHSPSSLRPSASGAALDRRARTHARTRRIASLDHELCTRERVLQHGRHRRQRCGIPPLAARLGLDEHRHGHTGDVRQVRAKKRRSQSGGLASTTTDGIGFTLHNEQPSRRRAARVGGAF